MTYQLSDIVSKVQQRVRDTGYSSSEIIGYINDAQNDVFNEYQLPFMQSLQTYTVTPAVSDITNGNGLPTNYVQALDLINTTDGQEMVIPFQNVAAVDNTYPDADDQPTGQPQYWYYYASTIKLYPAPADAYTLTLRYYKKPTTLADDADVPEVPSEFGELLVAGAAYRVLQAKDNYDQAAIHQNKYDELLQKFAVRYSQTQMGAPVIMPLNVFSRSSNF